MRILAIDPGPTESAWVLRHDDAIVSFAKEPNEELLTRLHIHAFPDPLPEMLAVEMIASYGMAAGKEVFETCVWIGRFQEASLMPVRLVYRAEVKMHLCHSMKANDSSIRMALIDKLGPPGKKSAPGPTYGISGDVWQALAVAVTAAETSAKEAA